MAYIIARIGGGKAIDARPYPRQSLLSKGWRSSIHCTKATLCLSGIEICVKNIKSGGGRRNSTMCQEK